MRASSLLDGGSGVHIDRYTSIKEARHGFDENANDDIKKKDAADHYYRTSMSQRMACFLRNVTWSSAVPMAVASTKSHLEFEGSTS